MASTRILCVDDSKAVHVFLDEGFAQTQHELTHVYSGEEAIEKLEGTSSSFDVVLLDWEMPGIKGPEVMKQMNEKGLNVPVVMLTSKNSIENIQTMISLGAKEYIMKPFTPDLIFDKLEYVLEKKLR